MYLHRLFLKFILKSPLGDLGANYSTLPARSVLNSVLSGFLAIS